MPKGKEKRERKKDEKDGGGSSGGSSDESAGKVEEVDSPVRAKRVLVPDGDAVVSSPHPGAVASPSVAPQKRRKETHWLLFADDSPASDRAFQRCLRLARHSPDELTGEQKDFDQDWIYIGAFFPSASTPYHRALVD
jgi:hypothetical protein